MAWMIERGRLILLVAILCVTVAIPAVSLAANPNSSASATLGISSCTATIDAEWTAQPGRYAFWDIFLVNATDSTTLQWGGGDRARNYSFSDYGVLASGPTRTYTARLRFRDHGGTVLKTVLSNSVAADCNPAFGP